jgi:hypothetical protein
MNNRISRRLDDLEQKQETRQAAPSVVIYDASVPGDAERKAAAAQQQAQISGSGNIDLILIPDNGRG